MVAFRKRHPDVKWASSEDEVLNDSSIQLVLSSKIANERAALGVRAMKHGKDFLSDKPGITTMEDLALVRKTIAETKRIYGILYSERLEVPAAVKAGELATLDVTEEGREKYTVDLVRTEARNLLHYSKQPETKPAVREVLAKVLDLRGKVEEVQKGIDEEQAALKEIADDQDRIRKNIERAPKESETFKRYLKKFDDQEAEIERRQARLKELRAELAKREKALRDYAEAAKAE